MPTDNTLGTEVAAIIMAAGRGSRMKGYAGNKTLLPLVPGPSIYEGRNPLLMHILNHLPSGPKAMIVHHCKKDVINTTRSLSVSYCEQPQLNGTGGAIIAARDFIEAQTCDRFIITMEDVPFVRKETYTGLVSALEDNDLVILGFCPVDKKQYGMLEIEVDKVAKITEWKFWKDYTPERKAAMTICNSGIYAVKKAALIDYLPILASRPQVVQKEVDGQMVDIEEFFITDLIEYMVADGKSVGYHVAEDEIETMGIDDDDALQKAQSIYRKSLDENIVKN
jgi:bifunctional UDP-N-acetylglucosamine pyrophosphorylase / glucosamine-1-phosphate N-acetyltransferase